MILNGTSLLYHLGGEVLDCSICGWSGILVKITAPLCELLRSHDHQYLEVAVEQLLQKSAICSCKQDCYSRKSSDLHPQLSSLLQLAVDLATEKGASCWLSTLPLEEYGFALQIRIALVLLYYGWLPQTS